ESTSFGSIYGTNWVTDYVGVLATWSRVLSVLMHDDHEQMDGYHQDNKRWDNHDVKRVQARDNVLTREFTGKEEDRLVGAHKWDRYPTTNENAKAVTGENIVRQ